MAGVLDLDAVVVETTEIKKTVNGELKVWALRDDIPAEVMLATFRMMAHGEIESKTIAALRDSVDGEDAAAVEQAIEEITARLQGQRDELTRICGEIFRHSYPEVTDDELRRWFTHDERSQIVQLFFIRRFQESQTPSSAITPTPIPNRQQRRAPGATRTSSRRSPGAIPSQKRLLRELRGA